MSKTGEPACPFDRFVACVYAIILGLPLAGILAASVTSCNPPSLYPSSMDLQACLQSSVELHKNCKDFDSQDAKLCNDLYIGSVDVCLRLYWEDAVKRLAVDGGVPPAEAIP